MRNASTILALNMAGLVCPSRECQFDGRASSGSYVGPSTFRAMMRSTALLVAILVTDFSGTEAEAGVILDENFAPFGRYYENAADYVIQQQVTADENGVLAGVKLWDQGTDNITIFKGTPLSPGPKLFSTRASLNYGVFLDTASADISLTVGEQFVIELSNGTVHCCTVPLSGTVDLGNDLYIGGGNSGFKLLQYQYADETLAFQTYVEQSVPEPSAWTMVLVGLGGIGILMRRRSRVADCSLSRDET